MSSLLALVQVVPYDPSIDTPLGHRNLVIIYVFVWLVQLAYGAYVVKPGEHLVNSKRWTE